MTDVESEEVGALDLDDTLRKCVRPLVAFNNRMFGTTHTFDDYVDDRFENIWQVSVEEAVQRVIAFHASEEMEKAEPEDGAIETVEELRQEAVLHIVTARPPRLHARTPAVVEHHFPGVFTGRVHFANTYDLSHPIVTKASVCESICARWIIDDTHRHAHGCAVSGIKALMITRPWNRQFTDLHPNILRIDDIREAPEVIRRLR